ncbi:hypothetical protein QJQ45_004769 [Haematococcus lacustris]|nr:hypothetical protein QJQ45_004769 [Haematococcus lacustris]
MQRIGESRWRPLELCYWPDQGALPAKGKEYPGLGYKQLRDKPPKAQQQQQQPAVAQDGSCSSGCCTPVPQAAPRLHLTLLLNLRLNLFLNLCPTLRQDLGLDLWLMLRLNVGLDLSYKQPP